MSSPVPAKDAAAAAAAAPATAGLLQMLRPVHKELDNLFCHLGQKVTVQVEVPPEWEHEWRIFQDLHTVLSFEMSFTGQLTATPLAQLRRAINHACLEKRTAVLERLTKMHSSDWATHDALSQAHLALEARARASESALASLLENIWLRHCAALHQAYKTVAHRLWLMHPAARKPRPGAKAPFRSWLIECATKRVVSTHKFSLLVRSRAMCDDMSTVVPEFDHSQRAPTSVAARDAADPMRELREAVQLLHVDLSDARILVQLFDVHETSTRHLVLQDWIHAAVAEDESAGADHSSSSGSSSSGSSVTTRSSGSDTSSGSSSSSSSSSASESPAEASSGEAAPSPAQGGEEEEVQEATARPTARVRTRSRVTAVVATAPTEPPAAAGRTLRPRRAKRTYQEVDEGVDDEKPPHTREQRRRMFPAESPYAPVGHYSTGKPVRRDGYEQDSGIEGTDDEQAAMQS
jgi:hypothetical protein